MNKLLGVLVAMQMAIFAAAEYNDRVTKASLASAAAQGHDTFNAKLTGNLFSESATSLTMVNGWKAVNKPNQCSVNLVYSDDGEPVEDLSGMIWDFRAPARRYTINDCSKLPVQIFRPYVSG